MTAEPRGMAVVSNRMIRPDVGRVWFRSRALARQARPGQFLHLRVPDANAAILRRPFSIHDVVGDRIAILYRVVGDGTRALSALSAGAPVDVIGPLGIPFRVMPSRPPLVVAGGIGIAPLQFLLRRMTARGLHPRLLYGCLTRSALLPHLAVTRAVTTDDGSCGGRGLVTAALAREIGRRPGAAVYACGPWPMLRETARLCRERGVPCQVSLEARMACGVGACQGCAVKGTAGYLTACHDGPVFDARTIDWDQGVAV
ncbi:MAG: dihydroorotate dehydrogenase electron transfer subunit [Candidatus Edwardsbacteria bacterium]|nr:dihydroorotate dehydrogenase electron transfer subunit [Candidatus Edwardsbacteria bacterium]